MPSLTVENYVKAIYQICAEENDGTLARANAMRTIRRRLLRFMTDSQQMPADRP